MRHLHRNRSNRLRACVCATSLSFAFGISHTASASPWQRVRHKRSIVKTSKAVIEAQGNASPAIEPEGRVPNTRDTENSTVPFSASLRKRAESAPRPWQPIESKDREGPTADEEAPDAIIVPFYKWRAKGIAARFRW